MFWKLSEMGTKIIVILKGVLRMHCSMALLPSVTVLRAILLSEDRPEDGQNMLREIPHSTRPKYETLVPWSLSYQTFRSSCYNVEGLVWLAPGWMILDRKPVGGKSSPHHTWAFRPWWLSSFLYKGYWVISRGASAQDVKFKYEWSWMVAPLFCLVWHL